MTRAIDKKRLKELLYQEKLQSTFEPVNKIDWSKTANSLSVLKDRLGKAGYITPAERRKAKFYQVLIISSSILTGAIIGLVSGKLLVTIIGIFTGAYLGLVVWLFFIRYRTKEYERQILFSLPLALESIILLVESGLALLPAVAEVVSTKSTNSNQNFAISILKFVYQLASHGIPLATALEMVSQAADLQILRHVLMHLDVSATEGGELIPALRSLSDHTHKEWKLTVETRVRRLENLVVFPVFTAVLGLMLLTAAVPLVPVLELVGSMNNRNQVFNQTQKN